MSCLYELRIKYPLGAVTSTGGVYRDMQGKGYDTEIFDHIGAMRERCVALDRQGLKWDLGERTREALGDGFAR